MKDCSCTEIAAVSEQRHYVILRREAAGGLQEQRGGVHRRKLLESVWVDRQEANKSGEEANGSSLVLWPSCHTPP